MTQPSHPAPAAPGMAPSGAAPPNTGPNPAPNANERGARTRDQRPDPGQFSYETVSTSRPVVGGGTNAANAGSAGKVLPPPSESAIPTQTLAPPPPAYRPGYNAPLPPVAPPGLPQTGLPQTGLPQTGLPPQPGAAAPNGAPPTPTSRAQRGRGAAARQNVRLPRRARLQLRHINPWTVFKFACALSIALFVIWLLTIAALYGVLDATGVVGRINDAVTTIDGPGSTPPIRPGLVFLSALAIGVVNVVLFIALTTIGSVVYNLFADLIGGIEVTLSERES